MVMKPVDLMAHPEGGRFREVYRSATAVSTPEGTSRAALTHIYFSLRPGEISRFHKVASDEVWNLYQGVGIRLYAWDGTDTPPKCITLSSETNQFCYVIPAGTWQAAEPVSDAVLVGCTVAPGFEFADFTLMDPVSADGRKLVAVAPDFDRFC
jgi:predicted cupin superfamily sugar epimerase